MIGDAADGFDDHAFALELLETEDVLVVPGSSFNVPYRNHFRVTLLPQAGRSARSVRAASSACSTATPSTAPGMTPQPAVA